MKMSRKNKKKKTNAKKRNVTGKTNRMYKDTIFADLFSNDIDAEDNVISLVNALYGTNLKKGKVKYKKENLESVLRVTDLKNDVSFMIDDKLLVLFEHQSTVNENMPLRCLFYCAELYKRMMPRNEYFNRLRMELPMPQFFVFYNGNENYEDDCVLKLSDSFMIINGESKTKKLVDKSLSHLELTVRMININSERNHMLLDNCSILRQYAKFTQLMKEQKLRFGNKDETFLEKKQREDENLQKMKYVVDYCKNNNILKDYFDRKGGEVYAMLKMEYSREYEVECTKQLVQKLQDRADEAEKALAKKDLQMYHQALNFEIFLINSGKCVEEIRQFAGCTEPYIELIYKLVNENSDITAEQLYDEIIMNNEEEKEQDLDDKECEE